MAILAVLLAVSGSLLGVPVAGASEATGGKGGVTQTDKSWWSFQPLRRIIPPSPSRLPADWGRNPVDRFIYAKYSAERLKPGLLADSRTIVRRIYFILTGLPPTPAEVDQFGREYLAGSQTAAIGKLVDRLLSAPQFGERWARHWMDVVRYADTHGTEDDAWLPNAWRYRDYLIRAFNHDLPYDQFVREHIAGDLLAQPRWNKSLDVNESLLATAWWRFVEFNQTPVDVKGEEIIVVDNQIDALSKAFLGLTVSCARCHDHKFDPISQRDFHGLYSILASTRTSVRVLDQPAKLNAMDAELMAIKGEIRAALAEIWKKQISSWPAEIFAARQPGRPGPEVRPDIRRWRNAFANAETNKSQLAPLLAALRNGTPIPGPRETGVSAPGGDGARFHTFADFSSGADCSWFAAGGFARSAAAGDFLVVPAGSNIISAIYPAGRYSHLLSDKHSGTFRSPNFTITNRFISALVTGDNYARLRLVIENFQGDSLLFEPITPKLKDRTEMRWITLPIRDNWSGRRAYLELVPRDDMPYPGIVKDASQLPSDGRSAAGMQQVVFHDSSKPAAPSVIPAEFGEAQKAGDLVSSLVETAGRALDAWADHRINDAGAMFLNSLLQAGLLANETSLAPNLVARYRAAEKLVPVPQRVVGVVDEGQGFDEPLFVHGDHRRPGEPVSHHFLEAFHAGKAYGGPCSGRLELARDVISTPLAARVMVNRLWYHVFGAGLVRSMDNFGKLGEQPSHPELLDWLAVEFQDRQWSIKSMLRLMLTSRAFVLAADAPAVSVERDPDNRFLSHANIRRLDAESLRDAILSASGRLDRTMFGPSIPVPIPAGQRDDYSPIDGPLDGRGRRSLYLEVRRNHPSPFLFAFDQPKPASPAGRRDPTNVPAQSLTLLNDPFVIQQAGLFAARAFDQPGEAATRIEWLYTNALARRPTEAELNRADQFIRLQTKLYDGEETNAWRDLAQGMINLKEFLYLE